MIPIRRIVWAIDAFQESKETLQRCAESIRHLGNQNTETEPVFVLPPEPGISLFEVLYPPINFSYGDDAEQALKEKLEKIQLPHLLAPKVIDKPILSNTGAISALIEHAQHTHADLIVVGTHGRRGVARLFLGSFAESLLLHSSLPILMVGSGTHHLRKYDQILFPTDFGPQSELVFPIVLNLAKELRSKLILFHSIQKPIHLPLRFVPPGALETGIEAEKERLLKKSKSYIEMGNPYGVEVNVVIECSETAAATEILNFSQDHKIPLIAMPAQSGAIASTIAGSTTRHVVRGAHCPVWVLHAPSFQKAAKEKSA